MYLQSSPTQNNHEEFSGRIIDSTGKTIFYSGFKKFLGDTDKNNKYIKNPSYINMSSTHLIDSRLAGNVSTSLRQEDLQIILYNFSAFLSHPNNMVYSLLAIKALEDLDFRGKKVLDLGSGEGVLSLISLKRGASKVVSIEENLEFKQLYAENLRLNDIRAKDAEIRILDTNILNTEKLAEELGDTNFDIVLANIGPHFGDTHLAAIDILRYLPTVKTFVGAGYCTSKGLSPVPSLLNLSGHGFKKNLKKYHDPEIGRLSFIIER